MRTVSVFLMVLLASVTSGCSRPESRRVNKAEVLCSLESGSRTATYVALWTLEQNGITVPEIDFEKPYVQAQPKLKQLTAELAQLPQSRLSELDESLKYHWGIYSPIWAEGGHGWKQ